MVEVCSRCRGLGGKEGISTGPGTIACSLERSRDDQSGVARVKSNNDITTIADTVSVFRFAWDGCPRFPGMPVFRGSKAGAGMNARSSPAGTDDLAKSPADLGREIRQITAVGYHMIGAPLLPVKGQLRKFAFGQF